MNRPAPSKGAQATQASHRRIVLVGHCGPDMHMLAGAMRRISPASSVTIANDSDSLRLHLSDDAVLLVNRVLDGAFDIAHGVELIRRIAAQPNTPVMMLISNYASAQDEAVAAGAKPGFGKAALYHEKTATIVRNAVAREPI